MAVRSARWSLIGDSALALLLIGLAFLPEVAHEGLNLAELPTRPLDALGIVALLAQCLPILTRRRWPAASLGVVCAAFIVFQLRGYSGTFASLGLAVLLYNSGAHLARHRFAIATVAVVAYSGLSVALHAEHSPERPQDYVTFAPLLAAFWCVGAWIRSRARDTAARQRRAEKALVTAERARIARDLHDVVTNHVTAIVVQADAGGFVTEPTADAHRSFTAISEAGRRALTELRHMLGVLDGAGQTGWHPSVSQLPELIERSRAAGQPVELTEHGTPQPMAPAAEVAAYRVLQEALTNALKHAPGERTVVTVRHADAWLELEIATDQAGPTNPDQADRPGLGRGSGRGLTGLRERLSVVGGELRSGPRTDGAFSVWARIPADSLTPPEKPG